MTSYMPLLAALVPGALMAIFVWLGLHPETARDESVPGETGPGPAETHAGRGETP